MQEWIIEIMDQYGYLGICALIAAENIFPPVPSELILTFGGFMTTYTRLSVFGMTVFSTLGSGIGALFLYWAGTFLTPEKLEDLTRRRIFRRTGFETEKLKKAVEWFGSHGRKTIFFGRCVPIIRSLISVPAGMAKVPMPVFLLYTCLLYTSRCV